MAGEQVTTQGEWHGFAVKAAADVAHPTPQHLIYVLPHALTLPLDLCAHRPQLHQGRHLKVYFIKPFCKTCCSKVMSLFKDCQGYLGGKSHPAQVLQQTLGSSPAFPTPT